MNFLSLCQRAFTECAASGSLITTQNQTGEALRFVNWVGDAWNELQAQHDDWTWMRSSNLLGQGISFQTVAGQASYPLGTGAGTVGVAADSFGKWDVETFRTYTTSVGFTNEMFLDEIDFDAWRNSYMLGAMRSVQTRPVVIAVGPDQSLNLGPPPNALYTVTGDYIVAPSAMVADTDAPLGLPVRFHMIIVYKAMLKYAAYEAAPEVYQRGIQEFNRLYNQLESLRLPQVEFAGALA